MRRWLSTRLYLVPLEQIKLFWTFERFEELFKKQEERMFDLMCFFFIRDGSVKRWLCALIVSKSGALVKNTVLVKPGDYLVVILHSLKCPVEASGAKEATETSHL